MSTVYAVCTNIAIVCTKSIFFIQDLHEKSIYNTKVVVKADKISMTAAATAAKEITLTFSDTIKDTTAAKITVKKANTTPTFTATWAADAKTVVLAMDSKLTKGTYDITVSGVEKEDLTASVTVEDQKLTAFELVSTNLVADPAKATCASIYFRAVDQYGKNLAGVNPTVTTSFGGTESHPATKTTENTKIEISNMAEALSIIGTKGTITIVDNKTGINLTSEITYVAAAKASKVEVVGVYNTNTGKKVETMTAGDNAENYKIALKFTDQYDTEMAWDDKTFSSDLELTLIAGTTNAAKGSADASVEADGKTYYAFPLNNTLTAGTFQLMVVNKKSGLLGNLSFDVAAGTVIKSFSVSADNDIYAGENATLSYVAVDANGNEVTKYDDINKALTGGLPSEVTVEKQKDGSAKLIYKYNKADVDNKDNDNFRGSDSAVLTFQLYPGTTNILVVNTSIKVNQARVFWEIAGVNSDKAVAGVENTTLDFKAEDFKIADQYGNTLSKDNINSLISANNSISASVTENNSAWTVSDSTLTGKSNKFSATVSASGIVKVSVTPAKNAKNGSYELTLSQKNAEKASAFEIKWNDGVSTFCTSKAAITANDIKSKFTVVGKVDGKTVTIPTTNYEVTGLTGGDKLDDPDKLGNSAKTIDGTVTVTVTTTDDNGKYVSTDVTAKFTNSNKAPDLASIKKKDGGTVTVTSNKVNIAAMLGAFELKDQYGNAISTTDVSATVVVLSGNGGVKYNGKNTCEVTGVYAGDKLNITITKGDLSASCEITTS